LRQEKRDAKRLNKERKLEQRRLEMEIARELKKPNEDMCLSDHKVVKKKDHLLSAMGVKLILQRKPIAHSHFDVLDIVRFSY